MIEVGKVYILNAHWHPNNGHHVLVVHSRTGVSDVHKGMQIYHIISDSFYNEPDWNSEYVENNFMEVHMPLSKFFELYDQSKKTAGPNYPKIDYKYSYNEHRFITKWKESRNNVTPGFISLYDMGGLRKYYDDRYNFIPLAPPN